MTKKTPHEGDTREIKVKHAAADEAAAPQEGDLAEAVEAGAAPDSAEALQVKADEYRELAQRVQADFENYKKRMLREQTHVIERASERVVREVLPVIDDLDRTIAASEAEEGDVRTEHLAGAVRAVREKLLAALAKESVEVIDPVGEPFDPTYHEAMMQVTRDDLDEQTVAEVYEKGYRMHDKLIRPARVVVSTKP
jgi:molecular chaperone GrpE